MSYPPLWESDIWTCIFSSPREVSLPVRYDLCWARVWHNRSLLTQVLHSIISTIDVVCNRLAPPATYITDNYPYITKPPWTTDVLLTNYIPSSCFQCLALHDFNLLTPLTIDCRFDRNFKSNLWVCFYLTIKYLIEIPRLFPWEDPVGDKLILVTYYYQRRVWFACPRHGYQLDVSPVISVQSWGREHCFICWGGLNRYAQTKTKPCNYSWYGESVVVFI